eukprot:145608-Hanusia_phi.AAC.1
MESFELIAAVLNNRLLLADQPPHPTPDYPGKRLLSLGCGQPVKGKWPTRCNILKRSLSSCKV